MSHYLKIGTGFTNIPFFRQTMIDFDLNYSQCLGDFIVFNSDRSNILFNWIGEEYELEIEKDIWKQISELELFINNLNYYYSNLAIMEDIQKLNYNAVDYFEMMDFSLQIKLDRFYTFEENLTSFEPSFEEKQLFDFEKFNNNEVNIVSYRSIS